MKEAEVQIILWHGDQATVCHLVQWTRMQLVAKLHNTRHLQVVRLLHYQLKAGSAMCRLHRNLDGGCMGHHDAGHTVKAIFGEHQQLHVRGAANNPLSRRKHTEELAPCLAQPHVPVMPEYQASVSVNHMWSGLSVPCRYVMQLHTQCQTCQP